MRVVFLDIDGVLNNPGTYSAGAPCRFVLCDATVGLDDPDVERAKWMLGQPRDA